MSGFIDEAVYPLTAYGERSGAPLDRGPCPTLARECKRCGALVVGQQAHDAYHATLDAALAGDSS